MKRKRKREKRKEEEKEKKSSSATMRHSMGSVAKKKVEIEW